MKKTISLWKAAVAVGISVIVTALVTLTFVNLRYMGISNIARINSKLVKIDALASQNFDGEIDYDKLDSAILSGYIKGIEDKYGYYKGPEDTTVVKESLKGNSKGLGITVTQHPDNKTLYVYRVNKGSPAEKAGLKPGDEITAVDGKSVKELGYTKSFESLQREIGRTVTLTVLRGGKTLTLNAVYGDFVIQSIYYHMIGNYGYIAITTFNDATVNQFKTALDELQKNGAKGLIFDVRNNGGGTVSSVSKMLNMLVPKGTIITVKYKNGRTETYESDQNEINLPMAVLTNENTASAAELFAANIRDFNKGQLFGVTTYGKGVMQRTYYLSDNSSVRLTVAKFYPKSGVSFDGKGLIPDKEVQLTQQQEKYFYMLTDSQDPVIQAAVQYLNGLVK